MSKATTLASGAITGADQIVVELVQAADTPAVVLVRWPDQPTVRPPSRFDATAAAVMRVLAAARVSLAQIKAGERQQTTD